MCRSGLPETIVAQPRALRALEYSMELGIAQC
jgi:hypothetical protein